MLSLESENRDTLDGLGDLAKCLASRCHIGKGVVMSQYKVIQDQVANLIERVPWLEGYRQKKGRAKVSKRLVVARGLKDVIRFNEEILQNVLLPEIRLELSSAEKDDVDDQEQPLDNSEAKCATPHPQPTSGSESRRPSSNDDQPTKRRKIHHSLDEASRFLLNPFNPPVSSSSPSTQRRGIPAQAKPSLSRFPLTSYVLSNSSLSSAVDHKPPTRLQLLAVSRGGSGEHAICDEELFVDGELEGMLRNEEEVETMRRILQFDGDDGESDDDAYSTQEQRPISKGTSNAAKKVQSGSMCGTSRPRKSKIDLEAFTKFMQGGANEDEEVYSDIDAEGETDFDDCDGTNSGFSLLGLDDALGFSEDINVDVPPKDDESAGNEEEEMVLDEWRPASPSAAVSFEGRYEEEYD
jgi:transcription factor IIIB subunit 2